MLLDAFARDLIAVELGHLDDQRQEQTRAWVAARLEGAGDVTRLGFALAGWLVAAWLIIRARGSYSRVPAQRRLALARKMSATRLPVIADYVRAIRGLAVAYAYEHGSPSVD